MGCLGEADGKGDGWPGVADRTAGDAAHARPRRRQQPCACVRTTGPKGKKKTTATKSAQKKTASRVPENKTSADPKKIIICFVVEKAGEGRASELEIGVCEERKGCSVLTFCGLVCWPQGVRGAPPRVKGQRPNQVAVNEGRHLKEEHNMRMAL